MPTRSAPPNGPPPRYTMMMTKLYPYSLQGIFMATSILGFLYGIVMGAVFIRHRGDAGETNKLKVYDLLLGILYLVVAAVEAFGAVVAYTQSLALARTLYVLAPLGVIVACADQIIAIIVHFILKNDIVNQCITETEGQSISNSNSTTITAAQSDDICQSSWNHGTWTVFAWLIITIITSLLFGSIALTYYRQLLDPSSVRTRTANPQHNEAFQMQPGMYGPPPDNRQSWMLPPYPGSSTAPPPSNFEKSDYQPEAEWAQGESIAYAPPSGPPPRNPFIDPSGSDRAEDEAWERARSEGVTAHLTGHAPSPFSDTSQGYGYTIPNKEEDEAWDRARIEGVTAHLTGAGRGGEGRV